MAKTKLRKMLFLGAMTGFTVTLTACGLDDNGQVSGQVQGSSLVSEAPLGPGWSMIDLAGVAPALLGGDSVEMPRALPMQTAWAGGYDYGPAYDYAPDSDAYYEPLDESYYEESSGTDDYLWLALAAGLAGVLGDSPPDYAFGYDGVQPWAWETADQYVRYAEPVYGGYRYYYYAPDTYRPFLVRDPYYSYGYRDDRLMMVYDRHGRIMDGKRAWRQRLAAREYYSRGENLYRAGHKHKRFGVPARLWDGHRDKIGRERREWEEARSDNDDWQRWDVRHEQRLHRDWGGEALLRRKAEHDFAKWQKADYRTPAPKFYTAENRREQLRNVGEIRREQASGSRKQGLALVQRLDQDHNRTRTQREQREQADWRGNGQAGSQFQSTSVVTERARDRRTEPRGEADRPQRIEQAAQRQERQPRAEALRQHTERKQRAQAQKERVTERRNQARQVEQRRKEQHAQRAETQRQTARKAGARRDRTRQQANQQTRRPQQTKPKAVPHARQERTGKVHARTQARKERQAPQEARQRHQPAREQKQRAERQTQQRHQARQATQQPQADRRQQQGRTGHQAQPQQVRQADARSQQQQARQERRRNSDR